MILREKIEDIKAREEEVPEQTMYDYLGVFYPEGYIDEEHSYVFNHSDYRHYIPRVRR